MGLFKRAGRPADSVSPAEDRQDGVTDPAGSDVSESYCRTETITLPWGDESVLVHVQGTESAQALPKFIADLPRYCDAFKPLRDHAIAICERFKLSHHDVGAIEEHLASLAELGVLTSKSRVLEGCRDRASAAPEQRRAIASTVIPTCNRLEPALRCLQDFILRGKQAGRSGDFVVLDDSPDADVRRQYREALRAVAQREAVEVLYAGREEKRRFVDALVGEGGAGALPRHVVEFALFGAEGLARVIGANRNASLLHTVGDAFLSTDDDTRGRMAPSPDAAEGLALVSTHDPTDFWFFPDRDAAFGAARFSDEDPWAQHERLLGRDLASCVAGHAGSVDLDGASSKLLTTLLSGEGRVRVTASGLVGDCGMGAPTYYLLLRGNARDRLVDSEAGYDVLRTTREVLRVVPRWTVADGPFFMATSVGLDNSALLPPFFPVQFNEDGVFGATLRSCFEQGFIGYLPWAIQHDPSGRRTFRAQDMYLRQSQLNTCDVLLHCVGSHVPGLATREPAQRLRALGQHLKDCGALKPRDFEELLRVQRWRQLSASLSHLEDSLAAYPDAPAGWTDDVQRCIAEAHACLERQDGVAPADLVPERQPDEARALVQRLLLRFGELLEHWPDSQQAARTVRERGQALALPLR
jgi:hypothetical protein